MRPSITILLIFILSHYAFAKSGSNSNAVFYDSVFIEGEKNIASMVSQLAEIRFDDKAVDTLSKTINATFTSLLERENSFKYPFDSIYPVAKVISQDGLVRIFTWFAVKADGTQIQYGFLQYYSKQKKRVLLYPLIDRSDSIINPTTQSLTNTNWFGATYYEIIQSKSDYGTLYVLLGWDGNSIYTHKKIIESLYFTESGRPKFGRSVFVFGKTKLKRVIFEYSRMASMMLHYDNNFKMIVMDHLAPSKPVYYGNVEFYGPDMSYDGLKFEDGKWIYIPEIDYKPVVKKRLLKR